MCSRRSGAKGLGLLLVWILAGVRGDAEVESLSIATYNVANYNLTDRQIEGAYLTAYPKPEVEKTALRAVIGALDADVLALQEIGGDDFLRELQRDLRSEGVDYPHAVSMRAIDDQRRLAVLSRVPFAAVRRHDDLDFKYFEGRELVKRGMLEVRFDTAAGEVALFVVHLKSKLTERRDDPEAEQRRGSEATVARDRVLEVFPEPATARFVIAGDFNSGPIDRPVRAFSQRGELEIARLIPAADSRGETWTHRYQRNAVYSRVDMLMVSPLLEPRVADGSARIVDTPAVLRASDHRPVVMVLNLLRRE